MVGPRGRPSAGDKAKRDVIAVRATAEFRERIDAAAAANGRSMSQEIEARLEASFAGDDELGGPAQSAFLRDIAQIMIRVSGWLEQDWYRSPEGFEIVRDAILKALTDLEPPIGKYTVPEPISSALASYAEALSGYDARRNPLASERMVFALKASKGTLTEADRARNAELYRDIEKIPVPKPPDLTPKDREIWDREVTRLRRIEHAVRTARGIASYAARPLKD